jgi:Holliday junction resolvase RusA-like endonuclease
MEAREMHNPHAMPLLSFCVQGVPIGKARPRVTARGTYMPAHYRAWLSTVKEHAIAFFGQHSVCFRDECQVRRYDPEHKSIGLSMTFHLPDRRRRDVDNLAGAVMDALNGVLWRDDSQIVRLVVEKRVAVKGQFVGVEVRAWNGVAVRDWTR